MSFKKALKFSLIFLIPSFHSLAILQNDKEDFLEKCDLLLDMSEYDEAIKCFKKALLKDSNQPETRERLAYACFNLGKIEEAIKYLQEELSLFPENTEAYDLLVYILFKSNRIEEASNIFERLNLKLEAPSESQKNNGLGDFILGFYFKRKGDFKKAKDYFIRARYRGYSSIKCNIQIEDISLKEKSSLSMEIFKKPTKSCGEKLKGIFYDGILLYLKAKTNVKLLRDSIAQFQKAIFLKSDFKEALFNLASIYYNLGEYEKALEYFKKLIQLEPDNEVIKVYFNCSFKKLNKLPQKDQIVEKCPNYIPLIKELEEDLEYEYQYKHDKTFLLEKINQTALEYIRSGYLLEGVKRFQNGLKIWSEAPEINYNLGLIYFSLENYKDAERHALIATKSPYFQPKSKRELKWAFKIPQAKGVYDEISPEQWGFELAIKHGNDFLEAYDLLGNIYFKKGEFEKSVKAFRKVIEIDPRDALGYYNLGCAYYGAKLYSEAENAWVNAIKHDKRGKEKAEGIDEKVGIERSEVKITVLKRTVSFHSYKSLGSLYKEMGEIEKAIESYIRAIELFPTDAECYYELGKLYIERGEKEKAIKCLEKYLEHGTEKEGEVRELLKRLKEKIK